MKVVHKEMVMCRCGWVVVVANGKQRGPGVDWGSATMLNSKASDGCSKGVDSEVVGLSLCPVHAWSLVAVVTSMIATIVVVVVLLPLVLAFLMRA